MTDSQPNADGYTLLLRRVRDLTTQRDALLKALKGIEEDAHTFVLDAMADVQEGGNGNGLAKWNAVLAAITKAEGRS